MTGIGIIFHICLLRRFYKVDRLLSRFSNITITFLLTNCISQLLYLIVIAPTEIRFLVLSKWEFGLVMCKLYKSWRSSASNISIMATVLMTADRLYGVIRIEFSKKKSNFEKSNFTARMANYHSI